MQVIVDRLVEPKSTACAEFDVLRCAALSALSNFSCYSKPAGIRTSRLVLCRRFLELSLRWGDWKIDVEGFQAGQQQQGLELPKDVLEGLAIDLSGVAWGGVASAVQSSPAGWTEDSKDKADGPWSLFKAPTLQILESVFAETVAARGSFFSNASSPK